MTIPVTGVSELVLETTDLQAAEEFYAGALGLPVVERWRKREAIWVMAGDRTRIGLWRPQVGIAGGRGGVHVHFALHLRERDFDAALARLRARGYEPHVEARRTSSRSLYVDDPDGNSVELWTQDVSRYLERVRAYPQLPEEERSAEHFDATASEWDASYEWPTVRGHRQRSRLSCALELVGPGPGELLEVGAGSGRLLAALAERGWTVTGVDRAPRMVELARERVPAAAERVSVGRAESLPFGDASFDAAVAVGVLEYTDMDASLAELVRVVRPGGTVVVGLRNGDTPTAVWHRAVVYPVASRAKRLVAFGRPLEKPRRKPLSEARLCAVLASAGLAVERIENVGCTVVPDPLDQLAPHFAARAAARAERSPRLRRLLGAQRLVRAVRPGDAVTFGRAEAER